MGPLLMGRLDLMQRAHFRKSGYGFFKINSLMEGFNSNTVAMAVAEANIAKPGAQDAFDKLTGIECQCCPMTPVVSAATGMAVTAIGDGTLLQQLITAFETFAASDFGKALISALETALLGFIGA